MKLKSLLLAVFCLMIAVVSYSQAPQRMSYQSVVRANDNTLVANTEVSMRISILQGSVDGNAVYTETHQVTTNANGLATLEIGGGETTDDFSAIDWSAGVYFVKTETDVNGGENYDITGVSQLLSVPYALYAKTAGNVPDMSGYLTEELDPTVPDWAKAETKPAYSYDEIGNTPDMSGYLTEELDPTVPDWAKAANKPTYTYEEIENTPDLFDGDYNSLTNKPDMSGYLTEELDPTVPDWAKASNKPAYNYDEIGNTPDLFDGDYNSLTNKPTIPIVPSNLSAFENDANYISTETQTLANVAALGNSANTQIKNVVDPTDAQDAVTKSYLDSVIAEMRASLRAELLDSIAAHAGGGVEGRLPGVFSVSEDRSVKFSQGNLQYQVSTNTWRFATNQYDIIGSSNSSISSSNSNYIDLFGWGTSGWNSGAAAYYPYSASTSYSDYYPGGSDNNSLTGSYANADWGVYNAISNGGGQSGMWRTLTSAEWSYLFSRAGGTKSGEATVNGVAGMVLLPDNWTLPSGCTFTSGYGNSFSTNTYTTAQWTSMQTAGAVFLPAAGYRSGTEVYGVGTCGGYWSSTYYNRDSAYYMYFFITGSVDPTNNFYRYYGRSVRLVQDN